jgi:hypothetical protein
MLWKDGDVFNKGQELKILHRGLKININDILMQKFFSIFCHLKA